MRTGQVEGQLAAWRELPVRDGGTPIVFLHGVPTNSREWEPFLARTGGTAPDLRGFGASSKRGDLDYTFLGLARWFDAFLAERGIDRVRLVVQDWGAGVGLAWAQDHPERVERLVVLNAVPLLAGYRWHKVARIWRTRGLGELAMGLPKPWTRLLPRELRELVWDAWDQGTQRAILQLYRHADPDVLAAAGARLGEITAPALVLWGAQDPFIPTRFAHDYAAVLGGAVDLEVLDDAGHWAWLDRPDVVERVAAFLEA